jgi:ribonuclease HIII
MAEKTLTSYTCKLTEEQAAQLEAYLLGPDFEMRGIPHTRFAGHRDKLNVNYYTSGKLLVQGKGTQEFVEFVLEPEILKEARLGYEAEINPDFIRPRLGVDESGKGDFFGPLVVAAVYVNESVVRHWQEEGIKDSKRVTSDKRIGELAKIIRATPGCIWSVVPIGPETYNRMHGKMRTVNKILAWGHARVIENLLERRSEMNPAPERAISDQFARSKSTVADALMELGRDLELIQRHKAEEDLAVAGASILARDVFVRKMAELSQKTGVLLPKGGGKQVDEVAKKLVKTGDVKVLNQVAKMHFRNAARALGLPELPRTDQMWQKK